MKKCKALRSWKSFCGISVVLFILFLQAANVTAQPARIKHVIDTTVDKKSYLGRDLWFTMAQNYEGLPGKYYELFVTSPNNTTVNITVTGGSTSKYPITAGQVLNFIVPLAWEVTTSGVVEPKGVRVWSNDADLTAYLLSRNPATSDGMFIIPTIGWGTEYVVAAYGSLYEGYTTSFDYPSEFSIIANQNNTVINIVPSVDIRMSNGKPDHKAHVPFTEILNKGECVQYKAVLATDCDIDVTGSIVTSNFPVGVVGASQCPNVPCDKRYCDHICDMIPPVRTWAKTYQTVPFLTRKLGDSYCVIGSVPGQLIKRNNVNYCTLGNKYEFYFRPDIEEPSQWTSDYPFMLVQYINSTEWETTQPGGNPTPLGDPAMVVVNSVEQYVPKIIFQTPNITSNGFSNYANVMVNKNVVNKTTMDGKAIASYPGTTQMQIPFSNYIGFRVANIKPGTHTIVSDSGVGVYVYGYGSYDSYAWSGSLGNRTFNDPDTIPPHAKTSGECYNALVTMTDNHKIPPASKISEMKVDSVYNMVYSPDPTYEIGVPTDSTYYLMNVIDITKEAFLRVITHDYAGNQTTVTSTYIPQTATMTPALVNYGSGNVAVKTQQYVTITNTGGTPFTWDYIKLLLNNRGFSIDSGLVGGSNPIPVGAKLTLLVGFTPQSPATASDTIELFDGCATLRTVLLGTGGLPDFTTNNLDFQCQLIGSTTKMSATPTLVNLSSKSQITIDSIYVDDKLHFGFDALSPITNKLPFVIAANSTKAIEFSFMPDVVNPNYQTLAHFHSVEIGWKTAILRGCGIAPGARIFRDTLQISQCATAVPFAFTIQSIGSAATTISNVVVTGDPMFTSKPVTFTDQAGNPKTLPITLTMKDETFIAYLYFTPVGTPSGLYTATISAVSDKNDTTNFATATVKAYYREITPAKDIVNMPVVNFGSAPIADNFRYCNTMNDTVTILSMIGVQGKYSASFSLTGYTVNGAPQTLPIKLAGGECVTIGIQFDPSVSADAVQSADFSLTTDACNPYFKATASANVKIGPPTILGVDITPTLLSCDTKTDSVTVTNSNGKLSPSMTITNITVTGADAANFIYTNPASNTLSGGTSIKIPVTFAPNASSGPIATNYSANVAVTLKNASGIDTTLTATVTGSANGMSALVSSNFAVQATKADENTTLPLPITIAFTKNGLADPIDAFGITKIRLVYTYNTNILSLLGNSIAVAVKPANGWQVDPASTIDIASGTLTVILTGPALTEAQAAIGSLGEIDFTPTLAKLGDKATTVALSASDFSTASGAAVGNCLAVSQQGTQFSLVYECGDSTLAAFLANGKPPSMIKPINPNPVSRSNGGIVNFQYVTRYEGIVSLTIYDELGKEVARVVGGQFHPAGTFEVRYDASKLSSGSYVYRFQLDNHRAISGRMVISN